MSFLSFFTSFPAVAFGIVALVKKQSRGMAITGLSLAGASIIFAVVILVIAAASGGFSALSIASEYYS